MTDHHDPDIQEQMDYEALNASTALKLSRRLVRIEKLEAVVDAAKKVEEGFYTETPPYYQVHHDTAEPLLQALAAFDKEQI